MIICREQKETLSTNKGRFCKNSEINTLISKRLSVENKEKLSKRREREHLLEKYGTDLQIARRFLRRQSAH